MWFVTTFTFYIQLSNEKEALPLCGKSKQIVDCQNVRSCVLMILFGLVERVIEVESRKGG